MDEVGRKGHQWGLRLVRMGCNRVQAERQEAQSSGGHQERSTTARMTHWSDRMGAHPLVVHPTPLRAARVLTAGRKNDVCGGVEGPDALLMFMGEFVPSLNPEDNGTPTAMHRWCSCSAAITATEWQRTRSPSAQHACTPHAPPTAWCHV